MSDFAPLLPIALEAVAIASDMIRTTAPGRLTAKGDRDAASEVDFAVERALREFLRAGTPDIAFLGEEGGGGDASNRDQTLWALDPVDGTMNFVRGVPLCGVSLALVAAGRPVVGVIDLPFLRCRYHGVSGHGSFSGTERLRVGTTTELDDAIVALGDYAVGSGASRRNQDRFAITEQLAARVQRVRMLGSAAVDLAWVAEGRIDASIIMSNKPWDVAAGVLIAREAGAAVRDRDGTDHTFGSEATITANRVLAPRLTDLITAATVSPR